MEIELDLRERWWIVFLPIIVVLLVLLILLGRSVTPAGDAVLTTAEWEHRKAERIHQVELAALRGASEELVEILNGPPDAVRANLTASRLAQIFGDGVASLELQRKALLVAAERVRAWGMAAGTRDDAEGALLRAIELLEAAQ
jgi:hypothetical protein